MSLLLLGLKFRSRTSSSLEKMPHWLVFVQNFHGMFLVFDVHKGWLKPKDPESMWTPRIVLGQVNFLRHWFSGASYHYGPPNHTGSIWVNWILGACPKGGMDAGRLVHALSRYSPSPLKGGRSLRVPSNSRDAFRDSIELDQLEDEAWTP